MDAKGYCTVDDVRRVMRETEFSGALDEDANQAVVNAIASQTGWLQKRTHRHWYEPNGVDGDDRGIVFDEPLDHVHDECDVPSSPHAGNAQRFRGGHGGHGPRYPVRQSGPYTRVTLTRRDVQDVTELLVRQQDGSVDDWTEMYDEGRGEAYYLQVADGSGRAHLYLHTRLLPRLSDYGGAVVATYDYGIDQLSDTVRRAVAMRAAAQLLVDDEAGLSIPSEGQLMGVESKVQALERQADELLEVHL